MQTLKTLSDAELITEFIERDSTGAFGVLSERYRPRIRSAIATKIPNKFVIDDLTQEILIKLLLHIQEGKYTEEGKFSGWVTRVTDNFVTDYLRALSRKPSFVDVLDFHTEDIDGHGNDIFDIIPAECIIDSAEDALIKQEEHALLRIRIQQLPDKQKEVVLGHCFGGLSFRVMAEILNENINTLTGSKCYGMYRLCDLYQTARAVRSA